MLSVSHSHIRWRSMKTQSSCSVAMRCATCEWAVVKKNSLGRLEEIGGDWGSKPEVSPFWGLSSLGGSAL